MPAKRTSQLLSGERRGVANPESTSRERVYDILRKKINSGALPFGHPLRIAELAAEMGVSPTPVREVLTRLEGEGLVEFRPYRGAVVRGFSKAELMEIFEIRQILECAALEHALPNLSEDVLEQARAILDSVAGITDAEVLAELNWNFHSLIFRRSGMPILCDMIDSLRNRISRYLRLYYIMDQDRFVKDHLDQLESCKSGDIEKATESRKKSMRHTLNLLLQLIS